MKYIIYLILVSLTVVNCNNKLDMMYPTKKIAEDKRIKYGISLNLYFPFELYINDIKVEYGAEGGGMMTNISPWILKSSKMNLRLVQNKYSSDLPFDIQAWDMQHMELYKWLVDKNNIAIDSSFQEVMKLPIKPITEGLASYTQQWEKLKIYLMSWKVGVMAKI